MCHAVTCAEVVPAAAGRALGTPPRRGRGGTDRKVRGGSEGRVVEEMGMGAGFLLGAVFAYN